MYNFIYCLLFQFFNEYTARKLLNEWNLFEGVFKNRMFFYVSFICLGLQIFLVEIGGDFVKTSPLTLSQWLITIALGFIGVPIGMLMRFIPVTEDPDSFFLADSILIKEEENDLDKLNENNEKVLPMTFRDIENGGYDRDDSNFGVAGN